MILHEIPMGYPDLQKTQFLGGIAIIQSIVEISMQLDSVVSA